MTAVTGFALLTLGAVLTWAITWQNTWVDLDALGLILAGAGLLRLLFSSLAWYSRRRAARNGVFASYRYGAYLHDSPGFDVPDLPGPADVSGPSGPLYPSDHPGPDPARDPHP